MNNFGSFDDIFTQKTTLKLSPETTFQLKQFSEQGLSYHDNVIELQKNVSWKGILPIIQIQIMIYSATLRNILDTPKAKDPV